LDANQAVSFFVCIQIWNRDEAAHVQSLSLDNNKTQENLVIQGLDIDPNLIGFVTISRYPMGATEEWIKEMRKGMEVVAKRNYDEYEEREIFVRLLD
jgi:hypothetical protein